MDLIFLVCFCFPYEYKYGYVNILLLPFNGIDGVVLIRYCVWGMVLGTLMVVLYQHSEFSPNV